ncbi:hypothetical protein HanRHA438_Chr09g0386671 [Helianthus annuus]|nr:hypothetical protein HanIR_Chr09g0404241 [Helianthus annuus]KAJ0887076.1 hypothetical protein HanRHA438_Chr09g0386671 [Helianthus annuus]
MYIILEPSLQNKLEKNINTVDSIRGKPIKTKMKHINLFKVSVHLIIILVLKWTVLFPNHL